MDYYHTKLDINGLISISERNTDIKLKILFLLTHFVNSLHHHHQHNIMEATLMDCLMGIWILPTSNL